MTPNPATQARLLQAARSVPSVVLDRHREEVKRLAAVHGVGSIRVFGSVASGRDTFLSDIDLLVTPG